MFAWKTNGMFRTWSESRPAAREVRRTGMRKRISPAAIVAITMGERTDGTDGTEGDRRGQSELTPSFSRSSPQPHQRVTA